MAFLVQVEQPDGSGILGERLRDGTVCHGESSQAREIESFEGSVLITWSEICAVNV